MRNLNLHPFLLPLLLLVVIFCGLIYRNIQFADFPYYDWDESIYVEVAENIARTGDVRLFYNGEEWLEKPPLYFSLLALTMNLFGSSEFIQRMVNVVLGGIAGLLLIMLSYRISGWLFPKKTDTLHPLLANLILSVPLALFFSVPAVVTRSTLISVDVLLIIGWLGFAVFSHHIWLQVLFLQIGVQAKSIIGFLPLIIESGRILLPSKELPRQLRYFVILLSTGSIWYLVMMLLYGQNFINVHFLDHIVSRVTDPIELKIGGRKFYFLELWKEWGYVTLIILASYIFFAGDQIRKMFQNKRKLLSYIHNKNEYFRGVMILLLPVATILAFTMSQTKIGWYLMPLYPFFSLALLYPLLFFATKAPKIVAVTAVAIISWSLFIFTGLTFSIEKPSDNLTLVETAKCVSTLKGKTVAVLASEQERSTRQIMEAAGISISTSFDYGGMPRFLYYSNKEIDFIYSLETFDQVAGSFDIAMLTAPDYLKLPNVDAFGSSRTKRCEFGQWYVFEKNSIQEPTFR